MALLESQIMAIDTKLPAFKLIDTNNDIFDSSKLNATRLALIVFTCNHCPYAIASWPVLNDLYQKYQKDGLQIVAINSNNNPDYPEDKFELMAPYKLTNKIKFPYLFDADQSVARLYQAVCTPDPYLFLNGKLFYHGRFNDNWKEPAAVRENSMEQFILSALDRGSAPKDRFASMGCSIKWNA